MRQHSDSHPRSQLETEVFGKYGDDLCDSIDALCGDRLAPDDITVMAIRRD